MHLEPTRHGLDAWTEHNARDTRDSVMRRMVKAAVGRQWEKVVITGAPELPAHGGRELQFEVAPGDEVDIHTARLRSLAALQLQIRNTLEERRQRVTQVEWHDFWRGEPPGLARRQAGDF